MQHRAPVRNRLAALLIAAAALPPGAHALSERSIATAAPFSTRGLRTVTRRLASGALAGRDNNTPESAVAQRYLIRRLRRVAEGVGGSRGDAAYRQPFQQAGQTGTNLLGVIRGRELPEEYVIVGAHYDHLDTRSDASGHCFRNGMPGGAVCPGATDNAAGVAAVLGVGNALRKLPSPPRRSVVLALWDAEEDGLIGSLYFVGHPPVPLAATVAYVNFDILGADLLPSLRATSFAVSPETGGSALEEAVERAAETEGLNLHRLSYIFGQLRSDYASFVAASVPTVFFSDSTNGCYHTVGDEFATVNFPKLKRQSRVAFRVVAALAEAATRPSFVAPNPGLATYADAVALNRVFLDARADLGLFAPADQALVQAIGADLARIVAEGPALLDQNDVTAMLNDALASLAAIARLGCRPSGARANGEG